MLTNVSRGIAISSILFCTHALSEVADHVLVGPVFTANKQQPWAEAVAVANKKIIFVGSEDDAMNYVGEGTHLLKAKDKLITPGFHDSHVHLFYGAASLNQIDLANVNDLDEIQRRIKTYAEANPEQKWLRGTGWLYGAFPNGIPHKKFMDEVLPNRPGIIIAYDGHTAWANSKALELAGIDANTPSPANSVIVKDPKTGEPTGVLKEDPAINLVLNIIPLMNDEQRYQSLVGGVRYLNSHGIVGIKDAGNGYDVSTFSTRELPALDRADKEGTLTLRGLYSLFMRERNADATIDEVIRLKQAYQDREFLRFGAVKTYVDGVIEARTAAVINPYANSNENGHLNWTANSLKKAVVKADKENLQVFLHAIGDLGVRTALDAFEETISKNGVRDRRGNIEHIEMIDRKDIPRLAELDLIASMQPLHAEPSEILSVWADAMGPNRIPMAFNWRKVEESGTRIAFGSDWAVVTAEVLPALYVATTREARGNTAVKDWNKSEAISLESALRHYTIDGAYASFSDDVTGSIEVGKYADLVVLSNNIFKVDPVKILETKVLSTMIGGEIVYQSK